MTPIRAALLTPAPDYPEAFDWALDGQAAALRAAGITVETRAWTSGNVAAGVDLVLPLVAWGYHRRFAEWLALLDDWETSGTVILNPVAVLRWNSDKVYLIGLAAAGIPTVPTRLIDALEDIHLRDAHDFFDTDALVIKPPVSAGSDVTYRLRRGEDLPADARARRMLVQPFQQTVLDEGEWSLFLFNGVLSHAVLKRARPGDYRVQPHFGGTEQDGEAPADAVALAQRALAAAPAATAYARVDLIGDGQGGWRVMELELIEPALFLHRSPGSAERFGAAIRATAEQMLAKR